MEQISKIFIPAIPYLTWRFNMVLFHQEKLRRDLGPYTWQSRSLNYFRLRLYYRLSVFCMIGQTNINDFALCAIFDVCYLRSAEDCLFVGVNSEVSSGHSMRELTSCAFSSNQSRCLENSSN